MEHGDAVVVDRLASLETSGSRLAIYDREIGVRLLYRDPRSGAEHYLIRYPPGLGVRVHRHTAAQTIVVLDGNLEVNGRVIGPGAYGHFPPGEPMHHAPVGDDPCVFVTLFDGPVDAEPLD
jgi:quercetin dioxygenase-like cupin family protein